MCHIEFNVCSVHVFYISRTLSTLPRRQNDDFRGHFFFGLARVRAFVQFSSMPLKS